MQLYPGVATRCQFYLLLLYHLSVSYVISHQNLLLAFLFSHFRLTCTQLALGILIFVIQIVSTALNDHLNHKVAILWNQKDIDVLRYNQFSDDAATGVWVGVLVSF